MAFVTSAALLPTNSFNLGGSRTTLISRQRVKVFRPRRGCMMSGSPTIIEKKPGMRLIKQADEVTIKKMGCRSWDIWTCEPSTFSWSYAEDEVCLVLSGEFTVIPDDGNEALGMPHDSICPCFVCFWSFNIGFIPSETNRINNFQIDEYWLPVFMAWQMLKPVTLRIFQKALLVLGRFIRQSGNIIILDKASRSSMIPY